MLTRHALLLAGRARRCRLPCCSCWSARPSHATKQLFIVDSPSLSNAFHGQVTQNILDKIPNKDAKCTYVYDRFLFHYVQERGVTYLAMVRTSPLAFATAVCIDRFRWQ